MIENIAGHLEQCTDRDIVRRSILIFANVDEGFARQLAQKLKIDLPKDVSIFLCQNSNPIFLFSYPTKIHRFVQSIRQSVDLIEKNKTFQTH